MSEDRIAESPAPPCPACATVVTGTPGASCPSCGRVFPPRGPLTVPDFGRRRPFGLPFLDESPRIRWAGILLLLWLASHALRMPGMLIPAAVLLLPAVIRSVRLGMLLDAHESISFKRLVLAVIASLGVACVCGLAGGVAFCVVCGVLTGGNLYAPIGPGMVAGWVVGGVVFLLVFCYYWPQDGSGSTPTDAEN